MPFVLPSLNIKFKKNKKFAHNQMLVSLPCSFNKFVDFHQFSGELPRHLKVNAKDQDKIKIDAFKYSSRMMHPDKLS